MESPGSAQSLIKKYPGNINVKRRLAVIMMLPSVLPFAISIKTVRRRISAPASTPFVTATAGISFFRNSRYNPVRARNIRSSIAGSYHLPGILRLTVSRHTKLESGTSKIKPMQRAVREYAGVVLALVSSFAPSSAFF